MHRQTNHNNLMLIIAQHCHMYDGNNDNCRMNSSSSLQNQLRSPDMPPKRYVPTLRLSGWSCLQGKRIFCKGCLALVPPLSVPLTLEPFFFYPYPHECPNHSYQYVSKSSYSSQTSELLAPISATLQMLIHSCPPGSISASPQTTP